MDGVRGGVWCCAGGVGGGDEALCDEEKDVEWEFVGWLTGVGFSIAVSLRE